MKKYKVTETFYWTQEDIWEFNANSKAELKVMLEDPYYKDGEKVAGTGYHQTSKKIKIELVK